MLGSRKRRFVLCYNYFIIMVILETIMYTIGSEMILIFMILFLWFLFIKKLILPLDFIFGSYIRISIVTDCMSRF